MPIGARVERAGLFPELPQGRRFFASGLWLCDGAARQEHGRPYPLGDMVVRKINEAMSGGGVLFIVGGLFSRRDMPTGFANGTAWYDFDFDVSERLDLMRGFSSDISLVFIHGACDDESLASHFASEMCLSIITPILPLSIDGREAILAYSAAYGAPFSGTPVICGDPGLAECRGRSIIDVTIERNGFQPYSEEQVIGMLHSLERQSEAIDRLSRDGMMSQVSTLSLHDGRRSVFDGSPALR